MSDPHSSEPPKLILASASPRRQSLLRDARYEFEVDPADIDESAHPQGVLPADIAMFLATAKARVVAQRHPADVVLAADTVVAFGDWMLGKPADANDARRMITLLAGTTHIVITGLCVVRLAANLERTIRVMSAVHMRTLSHGEIEQYIAGSDWQGKAGGYGIQDPEPFVTHIAGSRTNVVGLPMTTASKLLSEAGIEPRKS